MSLGVGPSDTCTLCLDVLRDVEEARRWVHAFVQWYNTEHRHSAIRFVQEEKPQGCVTSGRDIFVDKHRPAWAMHWPGMRRSLERDRDMALQLCIPTSAQGIPHMGSDRLHRWLALGANLATLLGLLMVIVQLQQNRELMRAQVRHDMAVGIVELLNSSAGNIQLAGVLRRAGLGEELTPDEQMQFDMRTNALFRYWEDVHYQFRQGLFDESEFSTQKEAWRASLASSKGAVVYWCSVRTKYSPAFSTELDLLLPPHSCSPAVAN